MDQHRGLRNEAIEALVNRIGLEVIRGQVFNNPLTEFKKGKLPFGSTVEEIQTGLVKAKAHDWNLDSTEKDVFGQARLDVRTAFHTINREDKYMVTAQEAAIRRAFLAENGLGSLIHNIMSAPERSDQWDEFLIMAQQIALSYETGEFFEVHVDKVVNKATAEELLVKIRSYVETLAYISEKYNPAHMPVSSTADELMLITTPEVNARLDVQALAAAFNIERAKVPTRVISIPEEHMPIKGMQAVLVTKDFWQVWDTLIENTTILNPDGLYQKWWFHHHGIYSHSRFQNMILFTSEPVTEVIVVNPEVETVSISLINAKGVIVEKAERGYYYSIQAFAKPKAGSENVVGVRDVKLELTGAEDPATTIVNTGTLLVSPFEKATKLTVKATSLVDPSVSNEYAIALTGEIVQQIPADILPEPTAPTGRSAKGADEK